MDTKNFRLEKKGVPLGNRSKKGFYFTYVPREYKLHFYIKKAAIRHVRGNKAIYQKRKETIERIFGTAKEHHGFRYTQYIGKARMEMKAGLTFACMNLKKLARFLGKNGLLNGQKRRFLRNFWIQFNFKGKNGAGMIPAPSLSTV